MKKSNWGTAFVKKLKQNDWVQIGDTVKRKNKLTEEEKALICIKASKKKHNSVQGLKTGWIDDFRNLRNKEHQKDFFIALVKLEFDLEVWPEFFFSTDRLYRIDYAIPLDQEGKTIKIAIEVEGGIWAKGNSGHSSGVGIQRDMDKNNLLHQHGWQLIRVQPFQIDKEPVQTLRLIKKLIEK